ncbi:uncharacterized protein LOC105433326, partial [Pogonomyrmex barbatus]|uniref:Uncharacterized protein LOC105433326 n=1 Tax=Pogonomyrmex barbatus TaxID=144034 RepID=A0A8N1SBS0_9HYME
MVLVHIKIHQILYILQICGTFTSTWPPEFTAGKREIFLRNLGWTLAILNILGSMPPLILGAWIIIQKYVTRYLSFSIFVGMSYILAAIAFSCGPLFLSITLPMEAWYPFSIETTYAKGILYILQVFAILQTGLCITVDFMIAMFFWYPAARLEMLRQEMQQITHENQIRTYIQKHQEIIRYVILK